MLYREITTCRSCGSRNLDTVIHLGDLAISDFVYLGEQEDNAPLELMICRDCTLVQLRHTVDRDRMYRTYYYRSGTNESMVAALKDIVDDACKRVKFHGSNNAVLDIGCNDGTLLDLYPSQARMRYGFEPCTSLAHEASQRHAVINDYFPVSNKSGVKANIITSIACFYDVDDPNAFVSAIKEWLHPDGVWVCQFQDLDKMLAVRGFDNICHEHLTYWNDISFWLLVERHGLYVDDVSFNHVNGGSVRYIVKHAKSKVDTGRQKRASEYAFLFTAKLQAFARTVDLLRRSTRDKLDDLRTQGKSVYGYGASTKGNTLLQYYGLGPETITAIADRNPEKWGRYTVGTHIPIISEEAVRLVEPDYLFVLPWHFMDSFKAREAAFLERGGQFIVPLPHLRTVGAETCQSIPVGTFVKA